METATVNAPAGVNGKKIAAAPATGNGQQDFALLPVSKISFSPLNYRKFYDPVALEEFAEQLRAGVEIIQPVMVRLVGKKYELVVGERRLRAAQMAELAEIPARIRELTDEQVKDAQLIENIQRENPHPLHEALAISEALKSGRTMEQVAKVFGKSQAYIYNRLKLAALTEDLQEIFFAGKLTMSEAVELGSLAAESQEEFFNEHCASWKEEKHFSIGNTRYFISRYKYDLKKAPFNTRDKKLVPEAGACSNCPFNSATLKTLFPDLAKEAVCSNKTCFKNKCLAGSEKKLRAALEAHQPEAIVRGTYVADDIVVLLDSLPETVELPRYSNSDIKMMQEPAKPEKEDYYHWNGEKNVFARERYSEAVAEYREDMTEYRDFSKLETTRKGLYFQRDEIIPVLVNPELRPETKTDNGQVTAKQVQQAMKEGTVTEELLTAEIDRIKTREERSKELDREKVQVKIHEQFTEALGKSTLATSLTGVDTVAIRYILYQALNYSNRHIAEDVLFPKGYKDNADFFEKLSALTDEQVAFLVRTVITGNSESKTARFMHAHCLYRMAEDAGLDVAAIEQEQKEKATTRQGKLKERIKDLQGKIKRMKATLAA